VVMQRLRGPRSCSAKAWAVFILGFAEKGDLTCLVHRNSRSSGGTFHLCDLVSVGVKNFEIERAAIRLVVCRHAIHFVHRKRRSNAAVRVEHQADVVQFYGQVADCLPNTKADVTADWRQKGVLKLRAVGMPSLERLEEWRTVGSGVFEVP
jgi:hypothetical protein